jgi:hypothetical protein
MVAVAILSVGVTAVLELFSMGLTSAGRSLDYTRAIYWGKQKMEDIILTWQLDENVKETGEFDDTYGWEAEVIDITPEGGSNEGDSFMMAYNLRTFNIEVTVFWPLKESKGRFTLETQKTILDQRSLGPR